MSRSFYIFILKKQPTYSKIQQKSFASTGGALEILAGQHLFGDHFLVLLEGPVKPLQALLGHHPELSW